MKWTLAIWHLVEKIFEHAIYRHNFFYKIIMLMALEFSQKKLAEKFKRSQMHAAWNFPHTKKKITYCWKFKIRQDYKMKHFLSNNCNWLVVLDKLLQFSENLKSTFSFLHFFQKINKKKRPKFLRKFVMEEWLAVSSS